MRRALVSLGLIVLCAPVISAQLVVTDPAVTIRNTVTATLKEYLLMVQEEQHRKLRRMASS